MLCSIALFLFTMREVETVQGAVNTIQSAFGKEYARMDFIFTHRHGSHRAVLLVLRGLEGMGMRVSDDSPPDIAFETTWVSNPEDREKQLSKVPQGGWENIATTTWRTRYSYLAHAFTNIRRVREVSVFEYGFELFSFDRIELVAIKSTSMKDPSVSHLQSIVGEEFKGIRLADGVDDSVRLTWRHPIVVEKAKRLEEKRSAFAQIGQSMRELLLDAEDV